MENIFETLGAILNPETLKNELADINTKIEKLTVKDNYLDAVSRSFPYGVGGSGRNNYRLNKRKERNLDKTIEAAKLLCPLYEKRDRLIKQIEDIENGTTQKIADRKVLKNQLRAKYWNELKVGDELNIGNSTGNPTIIKKNQLSVITTNNVKWTAIEIIGKDAMKFL